MNCIFCKKNSDNSKSVEHIIPQSLGNDNHILEKGIVCDACNNYFSTKIEREVLDLPYFRSLRNRNYIPNKKKKIPNEVGFFGNLKFGKVEILESEGKSLQIVVEKKEIFEKILSGELTNFKIPIQNRPPKKHLLLSRLLGKIAIEALAQKVKKVDNWNLEFVNDKGLDVLREYVRYGKGQYWEYYTRKVYEETEMFTSQKEEKSYQILNEYDLIYYEEKYIIFICIILGIEYAILLNGQDISIYEKWLKENNYKSPLDTDEDKRINQ
ncbi:HNH endonuclease [Chryseobacterium sp. VD8]|uniref:HNH endonuclease n=1 Tax=Chryseobacterium sp. VD8 TaxID=3081254 RepID=UPI0030185321